MRLAERLSFADMAYHPDMKIISSLRKKPSERTQAVRLAGTFFLCCCYFVSKTVVYPVAR